MFWKVITWEEIIKMGLADIYLDWIKWLRICFSGVSLC